MILHSIKEGFPECERFSGGPSWPSRFVCVLATLLLMVLVPVVVLVGLGVVAVQEAQLALVRVRRHRVQRREQAWARERAQELLREVRAQIQAGIREP